MSSSAQKPRIPLSPPSPPHVGYKQQSKTGGFTKAPASPVSPSSMSVATKSYVSPYENNYHTDEMSQRPPRSPPNTYSQSTQRAGTNHSETPNSLKRRLEDDAEDREGAKRQRMQKQDAIEQNTTISPTNHDRQAGLHTNASSSDLNDESAQISGAGKSGLKPGKGANDSGSAFLLCKSSKALANARCSRSIEMMLMLFF